MNQTQVHSAGFSSVNLLVIRMTTLIPRHDKKEHCSNNTASRPYLHSWKEMFLCPL